MIGSIFIEIARGFFFLCGAIAIGILGYTLIFGEASGGVINASVAIFVACLIGIGIATLLKRVHSFITDRRRK
jgi:tellurite resistance protein TehA-like permease